MKTTEQTTQPNAMLRWQFRLRDRLVTCGVSRSGARGYSVVTVPHQNVKQATIEIYKDLMTALRRHASIASELRASGWSIASYTTP